jgi:hypothetical protein
MKPLKIALFFLVVLVSMQIDVQAQDKSKKSVEPLYWENPLNFAYSELNSPKRMKLPKHTCRCSC